MPERKRPLANSMLEWITATLGALIMFGLIFVIGREALTRAPDGPAALVVEVESIAVVPGGFAVEIAAQNHGDDTAAAVQIEGTLVQGGTEVERSEAVIDYVPGQARRRAGLLFTRNPADYRLEVRATGYQEP